MPATPIAAALGRVRDGARLTAKRERADILGIAPLQTALEAAQADVDAANATTRTAYAVRDELSNGRRGTEYGPALTTPAEDWREAERAVADALAAHRVAAGRLTRAKRALDDFRGADPATVRADADTAIQGHLDALAESAAPLLAHLEAVEELRSLAGIPAPIVSGNGSQVTLALVKSIEQAHTAIRDALARRDTREAAAADAQPIDIETAIRRQALAVGSNLPAPRRTAKS
jgi:hypothetical protein